MTDRTSRLEVRTFRSRVELEALEGFLEENPVTKENYKALLGDYELPEPTQCCFQPSAGELCRQLHNRGYVVLLSDFTVSIIGHVCANKNFDAESNLTRDRNLYSNLKRRAETQKRLAELLTNREAAQLQVRETFDSLKALSHRMDLLLSRLGTACSNQLRTLARGGSGRVVVTGIRVRRGKFESEELVDRERVSISVGTLRGINVLRTDQFSNVNTDLRSINQAFDRAASFTDETKSSELVAVASTIADLPRVVEAANSLIEAEKAFLASDWSALPFLVRDLSDRVKLARIVIGHAGNPGGRDRAKQWLQEFETELKTRHGVNRLEIAY